MTPGPGQDPTFKGSFSLGTRALPVKGTPLTAISNENRLRVSAKLFHQEIQGVGEVHPVTPFSAMKPSPGQVPPWGVRWSALGGGFFISSARNGCFGEGKPVTDLRNGVPTRWVSVSDTRNGILGGGLGISASRNGNRGGRFPITGLRNGLPSPGRGVSAPRNPVFIGKWPTLPFLDADPGLCPHNP